MYRLGIYLIIYHFIFSINLKKRFTTLDRVYNVGHTRFILAWRIEMLSFTSILHFVSSKGLLYQSFPTVHIRIRAVELLGIFVPPWDQVLYITMVILLE